MRRTPCWRVALAMIAAAAAIGLGIARADSDRPEQVLVFADTGSTIEFMVPASEFWLVVPKRDFTLELPRESGAPGPRYFELVDAERDIVLSGWLEAAERFPGLTRLWDQQVKDWAEEEAPTPENVSFQTEGAWKVVRYQTVKHGVRRDHLQAARIERGVWIDLQVVTPVHLTAETSVHPALELLRSIETRRN